MSKQYDGKSQNTTNVMAFRLAEQHSEESEAMDGSDGMRDEPGGKSPVKTKVIAVRLTERQADELEAVALADGVRVSDAVRHAVIKHIAQRRQDKTFQARLKASLEHNREVLEKMVKRNREALERLAK